MEAIDYGTLPLKVSWANEFLGKAVNPQIELLLLGKASVDDVVKHICKEAEKYLEEVKVLN